MTPRRLEALRAMAAQNESPHERDIAREALRRYEAEHPEVAPTTRGRKTAPRRPDHLDFEAWFAGTFMSDDALRTAFEEFEVAYGTPGASYRTAQATLKAGPCPVCGHKHARTGHFCAACNFVGKPDCRAYWSGEWRDA